MYINDTKTLTMPYVVILKQGRKVAVMPTREKPVWPGFNETDTDIIRHYQNKCIEYESHIASLPIYEIPDFQDREPGAELTGVREQWQWLSAHGVNNWINCSEDAFKETAIEIRRIILVKNEWKHDPAVCGCENHADWCPYNPDATQVPDNEKIPPTPVQVEEESKMETSDWKQRALELDHILSNIKTHFDIDIGDFMSGFETEVKVEEEDKGVIRTEIDGGKTKFYWKDNDVPLGFAYPEVDGYYVFVIEGSGAWPDYLLRAIADKLTSMNKDWDAEITKHFSSQ